MENEKFTQNFFHFFFVMMPSHCHDDDDDVMKAILWMDDGNNFVDVEKQRFLLNTMEF